MATLKKAFAAAKKSRPEFRNMINAVVSRVGLESVEDLARVGANAGFGGFIYYSDTVAFFDKYRADILRLLKEQAADFGEKPVQMALNFNCFDADCEDAIGQFVYGGRMSGDYVQTVKNGFAMYAAEEVCRWICDEMES